MAITSTCSGCGRTLAVADEFAGRLARCPQCGEVYTVPNLDGSPAINAGNEPAPGAPSSSGPAWSNPQGSSSVSSFGESAPFSPPLAGAPSGSSSEAKYWMKATDGQEYGPVDATTLSRWFGEGRVGPGYLIRSGEFGAWQSSSVFHPSGSSSNPFAAANPYASTLPQTNKQWAKADQSGLVLAMGILSWFVCPICGIVAWVMGSQALRDIRNGLADPANSGMVQVGYYLGMVHILLMVCCGGGMAVLMAIAAVADNM